MTLQGLNMQDARNMACRFGGASGSLVRVTSSTAVECSTPAHAAGLLSLVMAHGSSDGGSVGVGSKGSFEFLEDAEVNGVVPTSGHTTGGSRVTVLGSGFSNVSGGTARGREVDERWRIEVAAQRCNVWSSIAVA